MRAAAAKGDEATLLQILENLGLVIRKDEGVFAIDKHELWIKILQQEQHLTRRRSSHDDTSDHECMSSSVLNSAIHALTWASTTNEEEESRQGLTTPLELHADFAIVGSIWWLHRLEIQASVSCSPLPCSPSSLSKIQDLLKDMPIQLVDDNSTAIISPDGVALLRVLLTDSPKKTSKWPPPMMFRCIASGLDSTTIVVGERLDAKATNDSLESERVEQTKSSKDNLERPDLWDVDRNLSLLETNIDDMTAEHLAFAMELLMQQEGVADCWITPIVMKKGRGAHTLHCLCRNEQCPSAMQLIFRHCTTLGVRVHHHETGLSRVALRRSMLAVPLTINKYQKNEQSDHTVDCKVAYLGAEVVSIKAEFDQCRRISLETQDKVPIQLIHEQAIQRARNMLHQPFKGSCTDTAGDVDEPNADITQS